MKNKSTMKWAALAAVIMLALFCTTVFAENEEKFAGGSEKTITSIGAASMDTVYGGSLNGAVQSTRLTVDNAIPISNVFGGGKASLGDNPDNAQPSTASVSGDTQLFFAYGYKGGSYSWCEVYGGGYAAAKGVHTVVGNTNIAMQNPYAAAGLIYGGGHSYGFVDMYAESTVRGNTSILLTQGNVKGGPHFAIAGGGRADNYGHANVEGNTRIEISGNVTVGNQNEPRNIFGGGIAEDHCTASVGGSTGITIAGGTLENINAVYGGGRVGFNGNGSHADISGDTVITIQGTAGLKAIGTVSSLIGGGLNMSTTERTSCTVDVKGTKSLVFDNTGSGSVSAGIADFDVIIFKGTSGLTFTKALSSDVKSVKAEGEFANGTVILTLVKGSHKPTIVGTNARWENMELVAGAEKETPAEPVKPVFEGDVNNVISKDVESVAPAVSMDITAVETKLVSTDIKSSDLDTDASGQVVLKKSVVVTAGGDYSDAYMLPIFTAVKTNPSADIVACSFSVKSSDLLAKTPQEVKLLKIKGKASTLSFKYSDKAEDFLKDGYFTIQTSGDNKIADKAAAFTADVYKVTMFIKDNGEYDLDPTVESILDPAAIVKTSTKSPDSGSSGGCSAGFAAIALLAIVPIVVRRKRNK